MIYLYKKIRVLYLLSFLPKIYKAKMLTDISQKDTEELRNKIKYESLSRRELINYIKEIKPKRDQERLSYWNQHIENNLTTTKNYKKPLIVVKKSAFALAIVETRKHNHFKEVVKNVIANSQHLKASLYIFHGIDNESFVKKSLENIESIHFINLEIQNMDIETYNKVLLSAVFWNKINADKILIFQTDSFCLKFIDSKFLQYDYIGAPWRKSRHKELGVAVGNGGFSIRSKQMMLDIIAQNIERPENMPEDLYLCQIIKQQKKYRLAPYKVALNFATEEVYNKDATACHKSWYHLNIDQLTALFYS